jgi:thiol-disulfide isomerase/thioredoxin
MKRFTPALLLLAAACYAEAPTSEGPASADEAPTAPVEVVRFEDLDARLAELRGEGTLLNFWALWCAPCVEELPELVEVAEAHREAGGRLVTISYDLMVPGSDAAEAPGRVRAFLDRKGWDFPVLILDDADYSRIDERFALEGGVPVTLALDAEGVVVDAEHGQAGRERFAELMGAALGR